jgi:cyclophilin family peptidyl-prolyl cis-trans isomerase
MDEKNTAKPFASFRNSATFPASDMSHRPFLPILSILFLCGASLASAKAPKAPTDLKVKPLGVNSFKLTWKDNSTDETGWEFRLALKGTAPQRYGTLIGKNLVISKADGTTTYLITTNELPGKELVFQVAAYNGVTGLEKISEPTSIVAAKAFSKNTFEAPTLKVSTIDDSQKIRVVLRDHATSENFYSLEYKPTASKKWEQYGSLPIGSSKLPLSIPPGKSYSFRARAVKMYGGVMKATAYSNVVVTKIKPFQAPSDFIAIAESDGAFSFKWKDRSMIEGGFELQKKTGTGDFVSVGTVSANQTSTTPVTGFDLNTVHQFRIRAFREVEVGTKKKTVYSPFSNIVSIKSTKGISSSLNPPIVVGGQFLYQIQTSGVAPSSIIVTGLPTGLVYDSTRKTITGTLANAGTYNVTITANYSDGSTSVRTLVIKTIGKAPIAAQSFAAVSVSASTSKTVSLTDKFSDPDTLSAARVETNLGTFDIILFPTATPRTVDNFLNYVDAGEYDNSFFHRSPLDFVVQGGGYKHTQAAGFSRVTTFDAVVNEPGLSNVRATVAMAKLGGQPDSATSQFFVNVSDNSANLDAQNEGFTVFGRVPVAGMKVLDAINDLPKGNYNVPIGTGLESLGDVPVNDVTAPAVLNPARLVKISSVGPAPILSYKVVSANPAVATASLAGTNITIRGVKTGKTTVKVTATDLDGLTVTQNIAVTVP